MVFYGVSCKFIFIDDPLYLTCFKKAKKKKKAETKKLQSDDLVFCWFYYK